MESEGTEARFATLYERHYDGVLAYCTRRIGRTDADDAAADVFAVAWRRLDEVESVVERAWLFGVARGVLANRWRSERRRRGLIGRVSGLRPMPSDSPDEQVVRRAEDEEVLNAVRGLKMMDREVLMLSAWEDLAPREIAAVLGISVVAAEQRLHRAKKRLAKALPLPEMPSNSKFRAVEERGGS
jgi:RNA polymerase sigma-70 factor (ECF subfamily)